MPSTTPHTVNLTEVRGFIANAEVMIAQAGLEQPLGEITDVDEGKVRDFSLIDERLLKTLACKCDGNFVVYVKLSGVIDHPTVVYRGADVALAVAAYNNLP